MTKETVFRSKEEWLTEVRIELAKRNWTKGELAQACGFSAEYMYRTLGGRRETQKTVDRISEVLNIGRYLI